MRTLRLKSAQKQAITRLVLDPEMTQIEVNPLSAVDKKFLSTTNERKVMSKTTFFKRIALTAIAALGFGMLSAAPSQSIILSSSVAFDADDTLTLDGTASDSATAVLTFNQSALDVKDSQTVRVSITSSNATNVTNLYMRVTETSTASTPTGTTGASATSPFILFGSRASGTSLAPETLTSRAGYDDAATGTAWTTANYDSITVAPRSTSITSSTVKMSIGLYKITAAGTYTVKAIIIDNPQNGSGGTLNAAAATWTVTVSAAAVTTATASSTATLRTGNASALAGSGTFFGGTAEATDSATLGTATSTTTDVTPEFTLLIKQKDANSTNAAKESYTVTVAGEAFITAGTNINGTAVSSYSAGTRPLTTLTGSNTVTGTKYLRMATNVADTVSAVHIWSTGTAGTATITATSDGGVVLGTKTVTFSGKATALTVSRTTKKVIEAGTADGSTAAFRVTATDSGGRNVLGVSPVIVSSNVAAISGGSCTDASSGVTDGIYSCDLNTVGTSTSGMAATLTVRIPDPAVTTATAALGPWLTTTYAVTMGGAVEKFVLTTDKATYDPGTAMVVTATAKDDAGNTPYDGQEGPTLRANKQLGGTSAGTTITMNAYYDGVSTSQTRVSTSVRTFTAETTLYAPAASGVFTITGLDGQLTPAEVKVTATVGDDGATAAANAASDAAAEAIDAANAATDAANLAAEAADAATVAAEEARDAADAATAAVEALATEVATLMAALKAQITTLANTVAKIAKKVKA